MSDEPTVRAADGDCPSEAELASYAWGGTAVGVDIAEHLATCERCSKIIAKGSRPRGEVGETRRSVPALPGELLAADTMVGRYRIAELLGQGGMGVVYRAIDTELDRPVALKLVRAYAAGSLDELTERLRRESRLQARASHPGVITVHDIGRDGDRVYVAMELAHGGTLRAWLARKSRGWRELVDVFRRAGEGLAAAHAAGLVHRDFKPDNVLVEEDGAAVSRVLVSDFGVARAVEAAEQSSAIAPTSLDMTTPGSIVGTPAYMAPEQLDAAPVDARTDVFAFGVGLWEALHGERPYSGSTIAELVVAMATPLREPPAGRERVPGWLDRVLRRALAIEPAERFSSMSELLDALDWRRRRRRARITTAVVSLGVTVVLLVGLALTRAGAPPSACDRVPGVFAAVKTGSQRLRTASVGDALPYRTRWVTGLDTYARNAERLRGEVCAAEPRAANWQDRVRCLDLGAAQVASLVDGMLGADEVRRRRLVRIFPPVSPLECATDAAAAVAHQYPPDERRVQVTELRLDLSDATVLALTEPEEAERRLASLGDRVRSVDFVAISHELALARVMVANRAARAASETLRDVAVAAERDGSFLIAGRAWLEMATEQLQTDTRRAKDLLAQSDVAIGRAGNPPRDRGYWYAGQAFMFAASSDAGGTTKAVAAARAELARGEVPQDLSMFVQLGDVEIRIGDFTQGLALHKIAFDAIAGIETLDDDVIGTRYRYASALIANGRGDEALEIVEPLVSGLDRARPLSVNVAMAIQLLATDYNVLQRYPDTIRIAETWQDRIDHDLGARTSVAAKLSVEHATAALALRKFPEAERASTRALETYVERFGGDAYDTSDVRVLHGQILLKLGRFDAALEEIARGTKALTAAAGESDPLALQGRVALAEAQLRAGQADLALRTIEAAIEPYRKLMPDEGSAAYADLILAEALAAAHRDVPRARSLAEHALALWAKDAAMWEGEITEAKRFLATLARR